MSKEKKQGLGKLFYIAGTVVLVAMLAIGTYNFVRDARVFQQPLLSTEKATAGKDAKSGKTDDYKTLKYKKPAPASSKPSQGKSTAPKSTAPKSSPAAPKPSNTGAIPSSEP